VLAVSIVIGLGASHTTLMNTRWDEVAHLERAVAFRDGLATAGALLREARPDVVVIVGSNHFRGLWLDLMPAFLLGVGEVLGAGEHGTPEGPLASDPSFARDVLDALYQEELDVAFSARLTVDHGITHAVQYLLADTSLPVVPLVVNTFAPPLPRLHRCLQLGGALGRALNTSDRRVAVIGSGGLSHALPFPDWRHPATEDDRYLVTSWLEGRSGWQAFEPRRRGIVVGAEPRLATDFDGEFLGAFTAGTSATWASEPDREQTLAARGGNGAHEIRSWLVLAAACGHAPARTIAYSAVPEWKTGMAVAVIEAPREPA
jgi:2,3-dihydroxyphenylpropionate 1,2-dioxygenase